MREFDCLRFLIQLNQAHSRNKNFTPNTTRRLNRLFKQQFRIYNSLFFFLCHLRRFLRQSEIVKFLKILLSALSGMFDSSANVRTEWNGAHETSHGRLRSINYWCMRSRFTYRPKVNLQRNRKLRSRTYSRQTILRTQSRLLYSNFRTLCKPETRSRVA